MQKLVLTPGSDPAIGSKPWHPWPTGYGAGPVTGGWPVGKKYGLGGLVVQHSSTDEVPLSKAPETPTCSPGAVLRLPTAPGVFSGSRMGQKQRKNYPQKGTMKDNLT